ncbi:uncharacterized protein KY384_005907 [Bacidia gigantensis]|uniref:uncharacterized protein n=1 Tax=Bacidia gigantensis TaxID=2732470 RepID=UPI001D03FBD5|nr:uncharacterized protein KY384_005907 [Bacidia gigantensis]KAG8529272.1 hypothetical protein KY384_005907 [Bacidia gigantensis]
MTAMTGPHLLNLPPPPSDTPSDFGPGTPNSGISQLSTVAIKEGERGKIRSYGHAHNMSSASDSSTNTLDAERADRISRLAGLERVATLRGAQQHVGQGNGQNQQQQGYFDNGGLLYKSTVGSASATGSIGGSVPDSADKMSEDAEDGISSTGLSDDGNASLVGFGEAASSSLSGPTSTLARPSGFGNAMAARHTKQRSERSGSPMEGVEDSSMNGGDWASTSATESKPRSRLDSARSAGTGGQEQAERIIGETMHDMNGKGLGSPVVGRALGKFSFEGK